MRSNRRLIICSILGPQVEESRYNSPPLFNKLIVQKIENRTTVAASDASIKNGQMAGF